MLAAVALVAISSAGALDFAKSGTNGAVRIFDRLTASQSPATSVSSSAAADQYRRGLCGTVPPYGAICVVSISDTSVDEPATDCSNTAVFPLKVTPDNDQAITVYYHTEDGTAHAAEPDYVAAPPGSSTVIPAHTRNWQITVSVCRDAEKGNEYFFVRLDGTSPNATLGNSLAKGTIRDKFK